MMLARIRPLLIAWIALLQCFVPLLHAHAHEASPGPRHVHIHILDLDTEAHAAHGGHEFKVASAHAASIGLAGEDKGKRSLQPVIAAAATASPAAAQPVPRKAFRPAQHAPASNGLHARPPATAPPSLAAQFT